jgi:RimJ/RimL family protein N-acetyltransferase
VPYSPDHVAKYHHWMSDPGLQYLTASEPLTLEEEVEMQTKWTRDPDKCTFIVLDKETLERTGDEVEAMVGDTNLFFADETDLSVAEIEIMIADPKNRGQGKGREALFLMMRFALDVIHVHQLVAKIKYDNIKSQTLFQGLGFLEDSRSEVFQEITFLLNLVDNKEVVDKIITNSNHMHYSLLG